MKLVESCCSVRKSEQNKFLLVGNPSLCYRHEGDGVCEDFEQETSALDCGFYTPEGFFDQWAHDAVANPEHQLPSCPARIATGAPEVTLVKHLPNCNHLTRYAKFHYNNYIIIHSCLLKNVEARG